MTPLSTSPLITASTSQATPPPVNQWALHTRLIGELRQLETCIRQSGQVDTTTQLIEEWRTRFTEALQTNRDERDTLRTHIDLMQRLLRDPISREPLTEDAVLGSDGHTYAQETIDVYSLPDALPAEWRGRSPLDIEDPRPFTTTPHLVIPHLIAWLRSYNSLLPPTAHQPPQLPAGPEARRARIQRVFARAEEAQERRDQSGILRRQLSERFSAFQIELNQMVDPLRAQTERLTLEGSHQLDALSSRDAHQMGLLRNQVAQMGELHHQALSSSGEQLEQLNVRQEAALEATRQNLSLSIQEERGALHHVAERVQEASTQQRLRTAPLAEGIAAYAQMASELEPIARQIEVNTRQIEQSVRQLDQEIQQLDEEDRALQENLDNVHARLDEVQRQEICLRQDIIQVERAIKENEKRGKSSLLKTVIIIGGACLFAAWALQAAAAGEGIAAGITISAGSAGIGLGVSMTSRRSERPTKPPQHRPRASEPHRPASSETPRPPQELHLFSRLPSREDSYARLRGRLGPPTPWLDDRDASGAYEPVRQTLQFSSEREQQGSAGDHSMSRTLISREIVQALISSQIHHRFGPLPSTLVGAAFSALPSRQESPDEYTVSGTNIIREVAQAVLIRRVHLRAGHHQASLTEGALGASHSAPESDPNPVRNWSISAGGHAATAEIVSFALPHAVPSYWAVAGVHVAAEIAGPLERRTQRFLNTHSPEDYALPPQLAAEALDPYQAAQVARVALHLAQMPSHALHSLHDHIVRPVTRAADAIGLTDQNFSEAMQRFYAARTSLDEAESP